MMMMLDSSSSEDNKSCSEVAGAMKKNLEGHVGMDTSVERSEDGEKGGSCKLSDNDDGIQFRLNEESGGGVCSPPLWSKSPVANLKFSNNKIRSLRVEAIARGQKEMMEMVKSMPDSSYELSLKDLVDHHHTLNVHNNNKKHASVMKLQGSPNKFGSGNNNIIMSERRLQTGGKNTGGGLLLKMVFPMPFGASKKAKHNQSSRRHIYSTDDSESGGGGLSSNASSGSTASSASSNDDTTLPTPNTTTRKKGGLLCGCSPFHSNKKKIVE